MSRIARRALPLVLLGCAAPPARTTTATPAATPVARSDATRPLEDYVGQYAPAADADMVLSVFVDEGTLWLNPSENPRFALVAAGADTFDVPSIRHRVTFVRDAAGLVAGLRMRDGGGREHEVTPRLSERAEVVRFPEMTRVDTMIPMRDGTRLHTVIIVPAAPHGPLPILLERTPYGVAHWDGMRVNVVHRALARDGYVFVFQDVRGRFASEGEFAMMRPPYTTGDTTRAPRVDESTDAYDTIAWLVAHVPGNNGRVGIRGVSYGGWLASMALRAPHPALRAASPQAPVGDLWRGDDFFHNGAFRLSYAYEFATLLESSREMTDPKLEGQGDAYDFYLRAGPLASLTARAGGKLPSWNAFVAHPSYDAYWQARAVAPQLGRPGDRRVPTLVVAGRWDQEDHLGPLVTYQALERGDARGENALVLGPWHHGQWSMGSGRRLGALEWGSATNYYFRDSVEAPWFAHQLKDAPAPAIPEALVFRSGAGGWQRYERWPPKEAVATRGLYLRAGGALSFEAPGRDARPFDQYVSDPADPVPYRKRPIGGTFGDGQQGWWPWLAEDQRFLADRADVLRWQTRALDEDVTVTGDVVARLFASTTGADADWVVKLIDVHPDSAQIMIASDILRGRYRKDPARPTPVRPGAVEEYAFPLRAVDHTFRKGHRIMVQVQSSWFPLYDRNPQTWVPNVFAAKALDFRAATHRVFRSARFASRLELPVTETP